MAVTATFIPSTGALVIQGDALANNIVVSRNAAGAILVNGGAVPVTGGNPTVANTALIQLFGAASNDVLRLDQTNGALPQAHIFGGTEHDTGTGGAGNDQLFGEDGNDTLLGQGGFDVLNGGEGNDTLTGGDADDQMFGGAGDDRMIWNPGDDTDLHEGGDGVDTSEVNGGGGAEVFTATANGTRVRFDRLDPAPFSIDIGTTENLVLNMNGGDDRFSATGNLATLIRITVDGGAGNDTILGSNGIDLLLGGDGLDFIDGQQGNDVAFLGAGDDVFQWDPGDGSDTVEGQDGADTLLFNGSNGDEIFEASANGGRVRFTRNLGNIVMDLDDVERLDLNALGGTDTLTVNDLSGTDLTQVNVNLAGTIGGTAGDAAADVVIANATNGANIIDVFGAGTSVSVLGLSARIDITNSEGANDALVVNGLGGNDAITATTLPAGVTRLTLDGGAGDDTLLGSQGADVFLGGDGNDFVFGDNGNDTAFLGAGDDVFQWDPGDGNDTIEGQDGADTMLFFGSGVSENINIAANGGRALFLRDVANVTMDLDDVERIDFRALGGADNIVVGDLSGTDVTQVAVDLRGPNGGGDGAADSVTVNATNGDDVFGISGDAGGINVFGLQAAVNIFFAEGANDRVTLNALGGDDVINASGLEAGIASLTMNGGLGEDIFIGSEGNDLVNGGDGNDTALMGAGDDSFVWNPGDDSDTLEGQDGADTMLFNGASAAERIDILANGGRVIFTRDIATVLMDLNDMERILFNALGGADRITVNDLSGTDVDQITVNLAGTVGGSAGDGAADNVIIQGTNGDDAITLTVRDGDLVIAGLAAEIVIENFEPANDRVTINGLGGNDAIDASALGAVQLTFDGGVGDDVLIGGAGADTLGGGDGDDVVIGNAGTDVLDGGTGDNIVLQDGAGGEGNAVTLFGTDLDNALVISRNAAGAILANGGAIPLPGNPTVANTSVIEVFGKGGNDTLTLDQANGALPRADLFGGAGNDTATGGAGNDQLFGEVGNDTLLGMGGFDLLFGGAGNDTLTGGDADDQMFGGGGDDRMIWNPGDDTDLHEGGAGFDTSEVNGGGGAEVFTATANGTRVRFDRLDPAPFAIDIGTSENLVVNMNGGNDSFSATGNLAALIRITVDGGGGDDTIRGSNGIDLLLGGDGNDFIDGQQGNDVAFLGAGDDVFQWDPGDGSDTVEGQDGADTLLFNGSNGDETFTASANAQRVLFTRNLGSIVMDVNDTETLRVNALGGVDTLTVNDLTGTDLTRVEVNLASTIGGTAGDGQADTVVVNGSNAGNAIVISGSAATLTIGGLAATVAISTLEAADLVQINTLGGNDTVNGNPAAFALRIDGGAGNDNLRGGSADDILKGGGDADTLTGGSGIDLLDGGAGNDTYNLENGTDSVIEADGVDTITSTVTRSLAGFGSIENLTLLGAGNINGIGNGLANIITGNNGDNSLDGGAGGADTLRGGLGNDVYILGAESDTVVDTGGFDTISSSITRNLAGFVDIDRLTLTGANNINGAGNALNNQVIGNAGNNSLSGADGNDFLDGREGQDGLNGGVGNDTYVLADGNDTVTDGSGVDRILSTISRNLESFATVENLTLQGTANVNAIGNALANVLVGNDGDNVLNGRAGIDTLNGGLGNDTYVLEADADIVSDSGGYDTLSSTVTRSLAGFATIDRLVLAGAADINGTGNALDNFIFGNTGRNILTGADGDDTLVGGLGRDVFFGNAGDDVIDFNSITETGNDANTRDVIRDFVKGQDRISLATIDADASGRDDPFTFIGSAAFGNVAGQLRFFQLDPAGAAQDITVVEGDVNGDGAGDFQIGVTGLINLDSGDFNL